MISFFGLMEMRGRVRKSDNVGYDTEGEEEMIELINGEKKNSLEGQRKRERVDK